MADQISVLPLQWELFIRKRASATQGVPQGKEALNWVANTATLFWGEHDAVLVDTFLSDAQSGELAEWIEMKGRTLKTIYLRHGHPDHFFGLTTLLKRFPEARAIARPGVVRAMQATTTPEVLEGNWQRRFSGLVPEVLTVATVLEEEQFDLEGNVFQVVDLGHTDTDDTTALYVPSLDLLVSGDAVYNETHPFLVETDKPGRQAWLAALDRLAAFNPKTVIVGHGPLDPDNSPAHIEATRQYIRDFDRLDARTTNARALYEQMLELYPNRINPGSLWGSAQSSKGRA